jgi:hypothetical protein
MLTKRDSIRLAAHHKELQRSVRKIAKILMKVGYDHNRAWVAYGHQLESQFSWQKRMMELAMIQQNIERGRQ